MIVNEITSLKAVGEPIYMHVNAAASTVTAPTAIIGTFVRLSTLAR